MARVIYKMHYFEILDDILSSLRERFMQPSFTLARQIENTLYVAAEGKPIDIETFRFVMNHFGLDLDADELQLNFSMLPGIVCSVSNLSVKPSDISIICDALNALGAVKKMYTQLNPLIRFFLLIPVTSASAGWSFSAMRQLRIYSCEKR
jgi:hypothetical protein